MRRNGGLGSLQMIRTIMDLFSFLMAGAVNHIIGSKRSRRFENPKSEPPVRHFGKEPHSITMSV